MAADGSDSASFTVRLVNQVMAPARQVKAAMGDVEKAFKSAQRTMAAPSPKRGALSDWDKMVGGAKRSQASDFIKQQQAVAKSTAAAQKKQLDTQKKLTQFHSDHGFGTQAVEAGSQLAIYATEAVAAAGVAAAAAVGYLAFKFTEASVEAGMFAQKSELAIGFLTNNAPRAAAQFDDVRHMAQGLGLQVDETVGSFERLLAMQFSVGKSKDLIKMAADMQAIGANGEEVQRILYAISEIKSMGTLQKRQERMLQMAGISGSLIDAALMKHTGITDHGKLEKARSKGKIGADVAVDAIMEAVMHKTHEHKLGQAGAAFATQTLTGMEASLGAGITNLYTDVGKRILPGITSLAELAGKGISAVMNDPELQHLGDFLVNEFEYFVLWAQANWPEIQADLVAGAHAMEAAIRFVVECFDDTTLKGQALEGVMIALAVVLGIAAVGAFTLMLPLYLLIAIIGLLVYAIVQAVKFVMNAIDEIRSKLGGVGTAALGAATAMVPGASLLSPMLLGAAAQPSANDNGIQGVTANGGTQALQTMQTKTEGSEPNAGSPVKIDNLNVTVPQAEDPKHQADLIEQGVHSAMAKLMRQAG